jgi:hypothetical protein
MVIKMYLLCGDEIKGITPVRKHLDNAVPFPLTHLAVI